MAGLVFFLLLERCACRSVSDKVRVPFEPAAFDAGRPLLRLLGAGGDFRFRKLRAYRTVGNVDGDFIAILQ